MLKEFKEFAMRGNVMDLAIGVVIGAAFTSIVDAFVKEIFGPIIAAVGGAANFSELQVSLGSITIKYGIVINAIINFLLVAIAVFLIVKVINKMNGSKKEEVEKTTKQCPYCLSEIPIKATRCPSCTSELEGYKNPVEN
ncbi:large conductance mechanosensitive channel protein MscL, partial [Peptostreptococcaceae bacterium OttesenSCG-928-C18]|nr:large conductance mechanosensitive channel protein MscL [Peptostreptococcaceae bacterium OttesenSCG-928-C18]